MRVQIFRNKENNHQIDRFFNDRKAISTIREEEKSMQVNSFSYTIRDRFEYFWSPICVYSMSFIYIIDYFFTSIAIKIPGIFLRNPNRSIV